MFKFSAESGVRFNFFIPIPLLPLGNATLALFRTYMYPDFCISLKDQINIFIIFHCWFIFVTLINSCFNLTNHCLTLSRWHLTTSRDLTLTYCKTHYIYSTRVWAITLSFVMITLLFLALYYTLPLLTLWGL